MIAAVGMALIGTLLNASGLEMATGREIDSDRELRGVGIANLAAVPFGGMIGYNILSMTLFARALGLRGPVPGLAVAAVAVGALFFGAGLLSMLPIGIFVGVLTFLGFDLLDTWIRIERRRLPLRDYAIVLVILAVAATVGFLQALAVGLLAAVVLFVIAYSGVDVLRLQDHRRASPLARRAARARARPAGAGRRAGGDLPALRLSLLRDRQPSRRPDPARARCPRRGRRATRSSTSAGCPASTPPPPSRSCGSVPAAPRRASTPSSAAPRRSIVAALDRAGLEAGDGHVRGSPTGSTTRCATSRAACSPKPPPAGRRRPGSSRS